MQFHQWIVRILKIVPLEQPLEKIGLTTETELLELLNTSTAGKLAS